jgi:hypothetical protein
LIKELDYYTGVFDNFSKMDDILDYTEVEFFVNQSITELKKTAEDADSEVFVQNALLVLSCLYNDREVEMYNHESKDIGDLDDSERKILDSLLCKEFT